MPDDRTPDFHALGRLIEERRTAAGLRPSQLAKLAKLGKEPSVGGGDVRAFELWARGDLTTVVRLLSALAIDDGTVLAVSGLDLPAMRARWEEWAAEPCPVVMSIRLMAAAWKEEKVPEGLDRVAILEWATNHPRWKHCLRCIRWSRKHCTYLRDDGTSYEIHSQFPENCPQPFMTMR